MVKDILDLGSRNSMWEHRITSRTNICIATQKIAKMDFDDDDDDLYILNQTYMLSWRANRVR